MRVEFRAQKAGFFDTEAVARSLDRAQLRALSKFGAFVRQRAKSSIRKSKKSAEPGQPPKSHEGSLKRLIFFSYDRDRKSVVIGPTAFRKGEAPRLLEHGGQTVRTSKKKGSRTLNYAGNPFMVPAAKAELPKFREMLRNAIQ